MFTGNSNISTFRQALFSFVKKQEIEQNTYLFFKGKLRSRKILP